MSVSKAFGFVEFFAGSLKPGKRNRERGVARAIPLSLFMWHYIEEKLICIDLSVTGETTLSFL